MHVKDRPEIDTTGWKFEKFQDKQREQWMQDFLEEVKNSKSSCSTSRPKNTEQFMTRKRVKELILKGSRNS